MGGHRPPLQSLFCDQSGVFSVEPKKFTVRTALDDPAVVEHNDLVTVADGADAVCDDNARTTSTTDVIHDEMFSYRIKCAFAFVKNKKTRIRR